ARDAPPSLGGERASRHGPADPTGLDRASDFAPFKVLTDVTVVGHAVAPAPTPRHPLAIAIGDHRVERVASAAAPTASFPLATPYLGGYPLAPGSQHAPKAGAYAEDTPDDAFQSAAWDLRLPKGALEAAGNIVLEGFR